MKINLTIEQKSSLIHAIAGALMGYGSGILSSDPYQLNNLRIIVFTVIFMIVVGQVVRKMFKLSDVTDELGEKKYGFKWQMSNGGMIYYGFWLIVWIAMYNRFLLG